MLKLLRNVTIALIGYALVAAVPAVLAADQQNGIAQSYSTDATIRQGMVVGLKQGDSSKVVPLTADDVTAMLGVAISASDAPLTLSGSSGRQVYVASSGRYNVLVSNQNGSIASGDYISISALNGIGMKADDSEPTVLGKAAASFNGVGGDSTDTLKTGDGGVRTVIIGSIPVDINVTNNPNGSHGLGDLPGFLQIATNSVTSKPVSPARVYLSLAILILAAFIAGSLLYSGVRSGLVSIGRNPLAKRSILRGLLQVVLTSLIVLIIGLFAVYLLLRL